jgi:hypothetical protein
MSDSSSISSTESAVLPSARGRGKELDKCRRGSGSSITGLVVRPGARECSVTSVVAVGDSSTEIEGGGYWMGGRAEWLLSSWARLGFLSAEFTGGRPPGVADNVQTISFVALTCAVSDVEFVLLPSSASSSRFFRLRISFSKSTDRLSSQSR